MNEPYLRWVILQVAGGQLVTLPPVTGDAQVRVAPGVTVALRSLAAGEVVAMPVIDDQLQTLLAALARAGVVV